MIQHVVERARQAKLLDLVLVATDDARVRDAVAAFGGRAVMTSPDHASGTDRIADVARGIDCEVVVNIQGDEPTLDPASIDGAVAPLLDDPTVEMATLCTPIRDGALARDPNIVKVVCDRRGYALYFSRAPIPYYRDVGAAVPGDSGLGARDPRPVLWRKHIGLYVYRREVLLRLAALAPSALELAERLEQLRALDYGIRIVVVETEHDAIGVDVPADIPRVAALLGRPASTVRGATS
jgi:3-deoxy-manno-octulosonate cytidylyltransferase (CMP-KDO synthetase)